MLITNNILDIAFNAQKDIIEGMDNVEDWAVSSPEINEKINTFIQKFKTINETKTVDKENIIRLVAYLHTGNMLNILNEIQSQDDEYIQELVEIVNLINQEDNTNKMSHLFAERLMVIYRIHVLPKIFSPERIKALNNVLNDLEQK